MGAVFVSHSKYDENMINFFTNITSRLGIQNYFIEWEDLGDVYPAVRISDIIRSNWIENVEMVVVLLGPNLANPPNRHYTQNWVTYEVGVAAGCKKPVLVLEDIDNITDFPIPYVTDYYQYQLGNNEDRIDIGNVLKYVKEISLGNQNTPKNIQRICGYTDCNARFRLWKRYSNQIHCPVCRRELEIIED